MNTVYRLVLLIIIGCASTWSEIQASEGVTNRISKALRGISYSAKPLTVQQAKFNHQGNYLNCIQFAYKIKDIVPDAKIFVVGGNHAIIEVVEKGRTITYSNGKVVRSFGYSKLYQVK